MPRKNEIDYLEEIAAKTGSATISGPVTVTNEVEIKNSENSPIPVSDNNSSLTVDGTVELGATSLAALENISVTFPSSQNVSVQNASLAVTGPLTNTELRAAAIPVSLATAPTTPVTGTFFQTTQPVSGPLTNTELRATAVPVSGTVTANTGLTPLTDTQLRATAVPVSLATAPTTPVTGTFWQATQPVSGPLTDTQLRATAVPVSGTVTANTGLTPLTDTQLRATAVPVSGTVTANTGLTQPLTDTQLRATAVPVSGTVTANTGLTQPLTDTQLRANAVPVSGTVTANNQNLTTGSGTLPGTSAVDTDIIASIDASGFSEMMVQFTGFPSFALAKFEVSNDNSTFVTQASIPLSATLSSPVQNIGSAGLYKLALAGARYVRLRVAGTGMGGTFVYSYTLNPRSSSNFGQLVSATTLPLPTGASTETTLSSVNTKIPSNLTVSSTRLLVDGSGVTQPVTDRGTTGPASVTNFSATSSTSIAASNSARKLLTIFNEGAGLLYVLYGNGTATTSNYSVRINSGDYLEIDKYTGAVFGIFGSAGTARITEIT